MLTLIFISHKELRLSLEDGLGTGIFLKAYKIFSDIFEKEDLDAIESKYAENNY